METQDLEVHAIKQIKISSLLHWFYSVASFFTRFTHRLTVHCELRARETRGLTSFHNPTQVFLSWLGAERNKVAKDMRIIWKTNPKLSPLCLLRFERCIKMCSSYLPRAVIQHAIAVLLNWTFACWVQHRRKPAAALVNCCVDFSSVWGILKRTLLVAFAHSLRVQLVKVR